MDLIADHISHRFGTLDVLDKVSFQVASGEVVAIVGPSGCGKSTLLSILGGLLRPSGGQAELRRAPPADSLNPLTFVFQDFALLPWCTVAENVEFPLVHTALSVAERHTVVDRRRGERRRARGAECLSVRRRKLQSRRRTRRARSPSAAPASRRARAVPPAGSRWRW